LTHTGVGRRRIGGEKNVLKGTLISLSLVRAPFVSLELYASASSVSQL